MATRGTDRPGTLHQHPLAYLLGLHGAALVRAFAGEHDRGWTLARIAEVRELLDRSDELGEGWQVNPVPVAAGYDRWAPSYDGDNPFFAMDEAVLLPVLYGSRPVAPSTPPAGRAGTPRTSRPGGTGSTASTPPRGCSPSLGRGRRSTTGSRWSTAASSWR